VTLTQLGRAEIPALCQALRRFHGDMAIGEEQHLLLPSFYEEEAALRGEEALLAERPVWALQLHSAAEIVGVAILEFADGEQALFGRMSAVAPAWRGRGLGRALLRAMERAGRAIAADLVFGLAELDNLPQCALLESEEWLLCGLVPESERRLVAPGVMRYVPEAIYVKILAPTETLLWPTAANLTPRTAALWRLLRLPGLDLALPAVAEVPAAPRPVELDPALLARLRQRPGGTTTWPDLRLLGVIDPRYQRSGLAAHQLSFMVLLARAIEAETVMSWATLRHQGAQRAVERAGWQLWGVIPASERYATATGMGRGAEALYGLSLVPPEKAHWPALGALPAQRAALVRQLFGEPGIQP
jgi:GNAT superfamily N-acetyltransferase